MTSMMDPQHFEELKASGDLPSPKGVALAIMRLSMQEDVSMAELASIIRTDPAFVGRLIKAANGVIGYGRRPIASVQDALTVLGLPAVRTMALGFSLMGNYRHGTCKAFDYKSYWSGSLACAVMTQAIAMRIRTAAPDEVYALGLLARVGELAMATLYPKDYDSLLEEFRSKPDQNLRAMEAARFGMDHGELGAAMMADWGMPRVFCEAGLRSETDGDCGLPIGSRERALTESLMIARTMGQLCCAAREERPAFLRQILLRASRLEMEEESVTKLCDQVGHEWQEWGILLNLDTESLEPFEQLGQRTVSATSASPAATPVPVSPPAPQNVSAGVTETAPVSATHCRVLLALADAQQRTHLKSLLLEAGYDVAAVADAAMAAEFSLDHDPDILIIDWGLARHGGDEMIRSMRRTRIGRALFVLALADDASEEFLVKAYEYGVDDVLAKPVSQRLLLARLNSGKRVASLHHEIERDRDEIRHYAAELAVSHRRLQEAALMDPLTGFPNRRFFIDRLQQEWASSSTHQKPLSCVMVDIDNFRMINDAHGHSAGDAAIKQVSTVVRQALRANDVIARTGGDEFLILCPDTAIEAARACAERLRRAVEGGEFVSGTLRFKVTVSVGVAARDASIIDTEALVRRTEHSLYLAKQAGRNRVLGTQGTHPTL